MSRRAQPEAPRTGWPCVAGGQAVSHGEIMAIVTRPSTGLVWVT